MDFMDMGHEAVLSELGARLRRLRLNRNVTQAEVATQAGISRSVIQNIEGGADCTLGSFVRVLRAHDALDQLDGVLPDPGVSPVQLARQQGRLRHRATGTRGDGPKGGD